MGSNSMKSTCCNGLQSTPLGLGCGAYYSPRAAPWAIHSKAFRAFVISLMSITKQQH